MKRKVIIAILLAFLCCLLLSAQAFAMSGSAIRLEIRSPVNSLTSENGLIAVEQFPAEIAISAAAKAGNLAGIQLSHNGQTQEIPADHILTISNKEACGVYTLTAKTDEGAVLTISANVVFQEKATYNIRYRTVGLNLKETYDGADKLKTFPTPQRITLVQANTIAEYEQERIAGLVGRSDGRTYTLKGSLVVEVYDYSTGKVIGTYDANLDFNALTTGFNWTPKSLIAFETMRNAAITYQAPVKINVQTTWCSEDKQEVYGKAMAQDRGVPEYLYPYQTTSVTFSKDDIPLSRNYIYKGLEWDYTPEIARYTDGGSQTQTAITQKINTKIPAADFYFKFKKQDGNDLSVSIRAPETVYRGDSYSFEVVFTNHGAAPAYDVPLIGTVDREQMKEIPAKQDFSPNESKTFTLTRNTDKAGAVITLWAQIKVPEGFMDKNLENNSATVVIRVVEKPEPTPSQGKNPDPDKENPPLAENPDPEKPCDVSASIAAPPTVYEGEPYRFTVSFTNHSDRMLKDAAVRGKNNDAVLDSIPKALAFNPLETKTYTLTGQAGHVGEVYNLWANIGVPEGFRDENPVDNTAASKITVVAKPSGDPTVPGNPPGKSDNPPDNPDNPPTDPDNPPDPGHPPVDPVVPPEKQCDVWVNLSYPPTVYEQEEYSFTVYFTNDTDQALSGVSLSASIDGKAVSAVPTAADFKAHETKAFLVKGKAGEKGTTIRLSAQVSPPAEYRDTNTSNNRAAAELAVVERPYDLDVQRITPDRYKENQTVISTIKVSNRGSLDFTPGQKVSVLFEISELSLSKRIDAVVMEKDTYNIVSVKWDTPNVQADKNITLIAVINPDQVLDNEESNANNTYTQKAIIKDVAYDQPEESTTIPAPPQRSEQPRVTWKEQRFENDRLVWKDFYAELKVDAVLDYDTKAIGYIKSGYGFSINVITSINTNYDRPELITAPQTAEVYLPQYRYETAIPLMKEGDHFTFKENLTSPFRYKKQYVPVWFPDDRDYIVQLLVTDVHTPGGTLSKWITGGNLKMKVVDNMYSDDVTTGSP
ncbi:MULTISPECIES: hypothetical protein [unclassified Dehalobacter]|jgi:hypothetical protein|uniref:hypothetical protein n=1 Tax=unclassified Dehalobacter TaxID=2635733 RepID=UPI00028A9ABF|nr:MULTISPECIES: hypothetical protein [unclassified Dehalobacter]AFV02324.1 hypothetical protein DHBDCA_p1295 [Dehalobacter sp. DCA]AFV05367.1 hypothetical protein DCF50_p1361 [Dehalobacter sp. CF]